ncbi:oligosaccharide flippase family protein [Patescibacteria group bacterium]|nr:oligosaccharide flippase family protein [Patescibacteria group bacterium]
MPKSPYSVFQRLISGGEKLAHIDLAYLARGGFWLGVGQISSGIGSLLLALVFANYLPKETYGLYKYALSIAGLLSIFTIPGMLISLNRASAQGLEGSLVPATKERMRWSYVGGLIGLCAALYYALTNNSDLALLLLIVSISLPFFDVFTTFNSYLLGKQDFRRSTLISTAIQLLATGALVIIALLSKNVFLILTVYFLSYSILRFISYRYIVARIPLTTPADPDAISYGKHLSVMNILSTVASNIDNLILFYLLGPVQVAIYSITTAAPDQLKSVLGFLTTLFFPLFTQENETEVRRSILYRFLFFFLISLAGILVYVALAPLFFTLFFHQYSQYVFLSQVFAVSLLTITFDPALLFLNAHKKIKEQYWSTTIGNVLQIVAIVLLAIMYGVWGVILARVIVRFLSNLLNVYFFYFPFRKHSSSN